MGYRDTIDRYIQEENVGALLEKSAEFHGHICSFSAYGVKAGFYAMQQLALTNEGMEEVLAIVEANNCFSDGIQLVTGCTFGNNALVFKDLGKTAVTVISRKTSQAIRMALKKDYWESRKAVYPELFDLFDTIVTRREKVSDAQKQRFFLQAEQMARTEIKVPAEEIFGIQKMKIEMPNYAPIHDSAVCALCGESVMETRARIRGGAPACISCIKDPYFYLDGFGIGYKEGKSEHRS